MASRRIGLSATRIALLGNQRLYRLGLARLLSSVAHVTLADTQPLTLAGLASASRHAPDILVLDLGGSTHSQLGFLTRVARDTGGLPVMVIAAETCTGCVAALTKLNVHAIISTWSDRGELIEALACTRRAQHYLSPDLVIASTPNEARPSAAFDRLSARQRQILEFIGRGTGVGDIARQLGISVKTVETHRARAMKLLGLENAAALTIYAVRQLHKHPGEVAAARKQGQPFPYKTDTHSL